MNNGYITYDEFKDFRLNGELTNLSSADNPYFDDEEVIEKLIEDSSAEMDMDLGKMYDITELRTQNFKALKRLCANLTIYYLYVRKGSVNNDIKTQFYDNTKYDLQQLGNGDKVLPGATLKKAKKGDYFFVPEKFTTETLDAWEKFY